MKRLMLFTAVLVAGLAVPATAATYTTQLASLNKSGGGAPAGISYHAQFPTDGQWVVYYCLASNVTADEDTNNAYDVFIRDLNSTFQERLSETAAGVQGNVASVEPRISGDGRFVAFHSRSRNFVPFDDNNNMDVFVKDRDDESLELVSATPTGGVGDGRSQFASLSDDGRFIAFQSTSTNLGGGPGGPSWDIFVRDMQTGVTEHIFRGQHPRISADGRYVALEAGRDIFRYDRETDTALRITETGDNSWPVIDAAGDTIAFNGDAETNLYVWDNGVIELASVSSIGTEGNQVDINLFGQTISPNGQFVTWNATSNNLVPDDTNHTYDVFVRDLVAGTTRRASVTSTGAQSNDASNFPSVTNDGSTGFQSDAELAPNDLRMGQDLYVNRLVP